MRLHTRVIGLPRSTIDRPSIQLLSILTVIFLIAMPAAAQNYWDPDFTVSVDAVVPYGGEFAHGQAYVYLGAGHTVITDPVIVVEGFDPDNSTGAKKLYDLLSTQGLLAELRAEGYDAVVLDFAEGDAYIQKNAMLLVELIQWLRDRIPAHLDMVVIGASMGGLVSRYALAWMEHEGLEHRVRTFISFDSPQQGACVPEGVVWFANF